MDNIGFTIDDHNKMIDDFGAMLMRNNHLITDSLIAREFALVATNLGSKQSVNDLYNESRNIVIDAPVGERYKSLDYFSDLYIKPLVLEYLKNETPNNPN